MGWVFTCRILYLVTPDLEIYVYTNRCSCLWMAVYCPSNLYRIDYKSVEYLPFLTCRYCIILFVLARYCYTKSFRMVWCYLMIHYLPKTHYSRVHPINGVGNNLSLKLNIILYFIKEWHILHKMPLQNLKKTTSITAVKLKA